MGYRWKIKLLRCTIFLYHYSGLEYIFSRWHPPKENRFFPTGPIWLIGIYLTLFGLASGRYELCVSRVECRVGHIYELYDFKKFNGHPTFDDENFDDAFKQLGFAVEEKCPLKPNLIKFWTTIGSVFCSQRSHESLIKPVSHTVENHKKYLNNKTLNFLNLQYAKLNDGQLENANLRETNLEGAWLNDANLKKANFKNADLKGASLISANLEEAEELSAGQICEAFSVYNAKLDPALKKNVLEKCPDILTKAPDWKSYNWESHDKLAAIRP